MCDELTAYINGHVRIRYLPDDDSIIYAFTEDGELIGEIPLAEKLNPRFYADESQVASHKSKQNRQMRNTREQLSDYRTPFEERPEAEGQTPSLVGGLDLTVGKKPHNNAVTLPDDKQYRQKMKSKPKKSVSSDYLDRQADEAFEKLQKLG
jgi:hypothetical protein